MAELISEREPAQIGRPHALGRNIKYPANSFDSEEVEAS